MKRSLLLSTASMKLSALIVISVLSFQAFSQLSVTTTQTINTNCNGTDCDYTGPSILINELMISPIDNDGTISGDGGSDDGRGEWIELYNPNVCEPIDISCYYLGNNTPDGSGGFIIPQGTIIPPAGFAMVRGDNVPSVPDELLVSNGGNVVEIVVPAEVYTPTFPADTVWAESVCAGGLRIWFPNLGGWFAFYDNMGIPQDAVSWGNQDYIGFSPCVPSDSDCNTGVAALASYSNIAPARKTFVSDDNASNHMGSTLQRSYDGGPWIFNAPGQPTYATCNAACFDPGSSTCTGTATANPTGGTPPYTYSWDDSQAQLTQTAIELCDGTYTVTVTDALGETASQSVTIVNNIPTVSYTIQDEICLNANAINVLGGGNPQPVAGATGTLSGTGVTGSNFNPATTGTGTFTVTYNYTDQFGCMNNASDNILVNPLPTGSITGIDPSYCVSANPETFTLTPAGGTLSGPGVTNNTFVSLQSGPGTHTLTYTFSDANGCENSVTALVTVVPSPSPAMTYPDQLCVHDDAVALSATPSGGDFQIGNQPATSFDPEALGAGEHYIFYQFTDNIGCIAFATDSITVLPRPVIQFDLAANYCFGTVSANLNPSPAGGTFTGDFVSGTSLDLSAATAGSYSVQYDYTDANGCENTLSQNFTVSPPVNPDFGYTTNCAQIAFFTNLTSPAVASYSWIIDNNPVSTAVNPSVPFTVPGDHIVQLIATDVHNCVYDTTITIFVKPGIAISDIAVGNVITANGDGVNDYIDFPADFLECYTYTMVIVNRWGNVVYEMSNTKNRFYGLNEAGKELSEGVYFYRIESPDIDCEDPLWKPVCSGNITITRN